MEPKSGRAREGGALSLGGMWLSLRRKSGK
jgi:hypothetical protein